MFVPCRIRPFAVLCLISLLAPLAVRAQAPVCPSGSVQQTLVQPPAGPICGTSSPVAVSDPDRSVTVYAYRGIPYAQPPTPANNLRWKNPVAPAAWTQPLGATAFQDSCPSSADCPSTESEDCLYLNVWVPQGTSASSDLPVMVFIHGGAFTAGSGGSPTSDPFDGSYMAARDNVIVVTLNYRLGALGGLVDPTDQITDSVNYNFGFRDQIMALNWVQANIDSFGGDTNNVTLFGESAGAMSVGLHVLSSQQSKGLFKTAIMESNPLGLPYKNMTEASAFGQGFAKNAMSCKGQNGQTVAACMSNKTACELVAGQQSLAAGTLILSLDLAQDLVAWAPALDDPQNPLRNALLKGQPLSAAGALNIPILLGTNKDEGHLFVELFLSKQGFGTLLPLVYSTYLDIMFGDKASVVKGPNSPYACKTGDCSATMSKLIDDYAFTCANRYFANQAAASPAKPSLYIYQFTEQTANASCSAWPQSFDCAGPNSEVCHGNELMYVFNTPSNHPGCSFQGGESNVSNAMVDYWTSFATRQAPSTQVQGWPSTWPLFQATPQAPATNALYLQISDTPQVLSDPLNASANCSSFWDNQIGYEVPTLAWSRLLARQK